MSYLKHHLSTVKDMLNDKILSQLIENEDELENFIIKSGWKQIHGDIKKTIEVTNQNGLSEKESINNTEQPKDSANSIPNNVEVKDENNNETIQEKEVDKIALPFLVGFRAIYFVSSRKARLYCYNCNRLCTILFEC
jgi:hypothetical protein